MAQGLLPISPKLRNRLDHLAGPVERDARLGTRLEELESFGTLAHSYASAAVAKTYAASDLPLAPIVKISLTLASGAANLILPAVQKIYVIYNNSGQTITAKITGQSGATVANGKTAVLYYNGTDIAALDDALVAANLMTLTGTETGTNKTFTTPVVASLYQNAGKTLLVTMPAATDTLIGKATTDELTNKTYDSAGTGNYPKNIVLAYKATVLLADLNAGKTLIAAVAGRTIQVLRYYVKSNGGFDGGGGTSVILQDTNGAPVVITTIAKAALTAGAKISSSVVVANVTDGVGFTGNLTAAKGIAIPADAALSVGTSIDVTIYYQYV